MSLGTIVINRELADWFSLTVVDELKPPERPADETGPHEGRYLRNVVGTFLDHRWARLSEVVRLSIERQLRSFVVLVPVATGVCAAVAVGLLISNAAVPLPSAWGFRGADVLAAMTAGSVGAVITRRQPTNRIGWLFSAIGLGFAFVGLDTEYVTTGVVAHPGSLPFTSPLGWLLTWIWVPPLVLALVYLPLLFPAGRLSSARWRSVAWCGVIGGALVCITVSITPGPIKQAPFLDNPLGIAELGGSVAYGLLGLLAFGLLGLTLVAAITSLIARLRASTGDARQQLKWFAFAAAIAVLIFSVYIGATLLALDARLVQALEVAVVVGLLGVPIAAGLAILRYHLYEIDRIISRSLAYAAVTGLLALVFVASVLASQAILAPITTSNTIAVAASTLLVFGFFQPLRRRVQLLVDRRFNRTRYDAERTVAALAVRMRDEVDLEAVRADILATVDAALEPSTASLWLRG